MKVALSCETQVKCAKIVEEFGFYKWI